MKIILSNKLILEDVPKDFEHDLTHRLKFINPVWAENDRRGRWNGRTPKFLTFFDRTDSGGIEIPRGYIRRLLLECRNQNQPYLLDDRRKSAPPVTFSFDANLQPFQQKAVDRMLSKEFGVLCAPTGCGKTVMALYMIAVRAQPALIIVHTKELARQWIERISRFLAIPRDEIGLIGSGKREIGEKITVAMVQTLYKHTDEAAQKIGFLVADECHRAPSRTFTEAIAAFDSRYMLGLSATPYRRDKLSRLICWYLGDLHYKIESAELVDQGHILQADIVFRKTAFKPFHDPTVEYSKMLSELTADDERNRLIASDAARECRENNGAVLVLSDRKRHCRILFDLMKHEHGIEAAILTGDTGPAERKAILDDIDNGTIKALVATGQLIGEGVDCKNLTSLFIATPIRFSGRVIQYIGRILRPAEGKPTPKVFDYVDVNVGPLKAAADARFMVYRRSIPDIRYPDDF